MAKHKRKNKHYLRTVFIISVICALACLITINETLEHPFLPTWDQIGEAIGITDTSVTLPESELQVHMIDVGNADALLIRNKDKNMLIDAGENSDGDDVVDYLKKQGVKKLDLVIATHPDADHIGGMDTVVDNLDIGTFILAYMPKGYTPTTKTYESMLTSLLNKDIKITPAKVGEQYMLGDAKIDILGPVGDYTQTNNQSVVCKLTFGKNKFLFTGDAEEEAEEAILRSGVDLKADVLKVGHHGSGSSTDKKFLAAVRPRYALIPCGKDNSYNHPSPATLQRLQSANAAIYRADLNGTVVVTSNGTDISVKPEKASVS